MLMARRPNNLKQELAALDREVIEDRGTARRFHKAISLSVRLWRWSDLGR